MKPVLNILSYATPTFVEGALNVWPHQAKNPDLLQSMLDHRAGLSKKVNARDLEIVEPSSTEAMVFMNKNHLDGGLGSTFIYGLANNGVLLFVVTLGKPRFNNHYDLEVLRMATEQGYVVRGGASKVFSWIQQKHPEKSIITYADRILGTGNVYKQAGFRPIVDLTKKQAGYFWERNGELKSRYQSTKRKLHRFLDNFDPTISQTKSMVREGWNKVHTPGNTAWYLPRLVQKPESEDQAALKKYHYTYITTRPSIDECYYIGIHSTNDEPERDKYLGSGDLIVASIDKYGAGAHVKKILQQFGTRLEASAEEAALVTMETLADPLCLNLVPGGGTPWIPEGTTTNMIWVYHEGMNKECFIEPKYLERFEQKNWTKRRSPASLQSIVGSKWYKAEDGTYGRAKGDLPAGAVLGKQASTTGRKWVQRNEKQEYVKEVEVLETDEKKFNQSKTNAGKKRLIDQAGVERMVNEEAVEQLLQQGWTRPKPPLEGKIGMRSPDGVKKMVFEPEADALWELGWRNANKQLKSAAPHVLAFVAKHGVKLPVKKTKLKGT